MMRSFVAGLAVLGLAACNGGAGHGTTVVWPDAHDANAAIGRGVEIVSPCCDDGPGTIEGAARAAVEAGFDSVRYAVHLSTKQDLVPPYGIDPAYLAQIRAEIDVLLAHGLTVIINNNDNLADPDHTGDRLPILWRQVADSFKDLPASVYFEIQNEPTWTGFESPIGEGDWNQIVAAVVPAIRATNPERTIVVSSPYFSFPQNIPTLELPADDGHLIATFHYYFPIEYTHQGSWIPGSELWIGTTWPGTPDQVAAMKETMNDTVCWSRATGIPLFLGEFSPYDAGEYPDPLLWTTTLIQLVEAEHISWTYFHLVGHLDPETNVISHNLLWDESVDVWNQPILDALNEASATPIAPWASCE